MAEKIKIGGVPEHFNLPWHIAIEEQMFSEEGIEAEWQDYPGGTGAMKEALRNNELDLAVILTEGIVADIVKGNPSKILQVYVETPLIWGIHVPAHTDYQSMDELKGKRYAISRKGSGSHLMAFVDAERRGWDTKNLEFLIVQNLDGARKALQDEHAHIFLWEKFTTQPYVDRKEFRRIDECPTPWPCFVIAGTENILQKKPEEVKKVLKIIQSACKKLIDNPKRASLISKRYHLDKNEAELWLQQTQWNTSGTINPELLVKVQETLTKLGLINETEPPESMICDLSSVSG